MADPTACAVFRMSRLAILAVLVSAGCALPFATDSRLASWGSDTR